MSCPPLTNQTASRLNFTVYLPGLVKPLVASTLLDLFASPFAELTHQLKDPFLRDKVSHQKISHWRFVGATCEHEARAGLARGLDRGARCEQKFLWRHCDRAYLWASAGRAHSRAAFQNQLEVVRMMSALLQSATNSRCLSMTQFPPCS